MRDYNKKVKLQYKLLSRVYGLMDLLLFPEGRPNPYHGLVKHIPNTAFSVLDVCCGTGNTSIAIASSNCNSRVTGIDLSEDMLRVAKKKIQKKNLQNITTLCKDAAQTGLTEEFDAAVTSLSLHEMPSGVMNSVAAEMARVLKTGGRMFIIEWDRPKSFPGKFLFMFFPYLFEPKGFGGFLNMDWEGYLRQYGMQVEQIERYTFTKLIIARKIHISGG